MPPKKRGRKPAAKKATEPGPSEPPPAEEAPPPVEEAPPSPPKTRRGRQTRGAKKAAEKPVEKETGPPEKPPVETPPKKDPPKKEPAKRGRNKPEPKKRVNEELNMRILAMTSNRELSAKRRLNWKFGVTSRSRRTTKAPEPLRFEEEPLFRSDTVHDYLRGTSQLCSKDVKDVFACGLCEGYIVEALTVVDCLHTFCKSCLLKYFEEDETTCPTCGILIHQSYPEQYVTYDRALSDLIFNLVPQLEKTETMKRRQFVIDNNGEGLLLAAERRKKEQDEKERMIGTNRCYKGDAEISHHRDETQVTIRFISACRHLPIPSRPYIKVSEMTTINTLRKYLAVALWDQRGRYDELEITTKKADVLGKDYSIRFVQMTKLRGEPRDEILNLFYTLREDC